MPTSSAAGLYDLRASERVKGIKPHGSGIGSGRCVKDLLKRHEIFQTHQRDRHVKMPLCGRDEMLTTYIDGGGKAFARVCHWSQSIFTAILCDDLKNPWGEAKVEVVRCSELNWVER